MVMEAGRRGRSEACDEARLPRAALTRAINNVDAARIWKRWRGFRAAAAVVCGSDAGSITSCSCCAHVLCAGCSACSSSRRTRRFHMARGVAVAGSFTPSCCLLTNVSTAPRGSATAPRVVEQHASKLARVIVLRWPWD